MMNCLYKVITLYNIKYSYLKSHGALANSAILFSYGYFELILFFSSTTAPAMLTAASTLRKFRISNFKISKIQFEHGNKKLKR